MRLKRIVLVRDQYGNEIPDPNYDYYVDTDDPYGDIISMKKYNLGARHEDIPNKKPKVYKIK